MKSLLLILVSTVLANNFVLVRFLGLCPFMGVSNKFEGAMGMAVATAFVLTLSSASSYLLHTYLLVPLGLQYLSTLSFILVIAVMVQLTEMIMRKSAPLLYLVSRRREVEVPWRERSNHTRLTLGRMVPDEARALVRDLGRGLSEEVVERILERADGMPAFLVELTRAVVSMPGIMNTSPTLGLDSKFW